MTQTLIHNREHMRQIKDFSGLRFGKISPTDIDGFLDFGDKLFVFVEMKYGNAEIPLGQRIALTRLCDAVVSKDRKSYLLIVRHELSSESDINVSEQIISDVYFNKRWHKAKNGWTLRDAINWLLETHNLKGN